MITYEIYKSAASNNRMSVHLNFYRDGELSRVATIATVDPLAAVQILMEAQVHLRKLGVPRAIKPLAMAA